MRFREIRGRRSIASGGYAGGFHGFGQAAAHGAENEGGNIALGLDGEIGGFAGKFSAAVELQTTLAEEFGREARIGGAVNAPEPQLFLVALEELQRLLKLLHGAVEGTGKEEDAEGPGVPRVENAQADAILSPLIALNAAAIVVANCGYTRDGRFGHDKFPRVIV